MSYYGTPEHRRMRADDLPLEALAAVNGTEVQPG